MFAESFGHLLLGFAPKQFAIMVSAEDRLLRESITAEIMDNIEDFWIWAKTSLQIYVGEQTRGKLQSAVSRILTAGDSAGCYLSLQLGLSHPNDIRVVTAAYPLVDIKRPHFCEKLEKNLLMTPQLPDSLVSDHLKSKYKTQKLSSPGQEGTIVVTSDP